MQLATASQSKRGASLDHPRTTVGGRPLLALAAGLLVLAVGAGLVAAHVTVFALDETLIEQSAVHYTSGLPHTLFHDLDARATNRLYSLVLSIPLRLFRAAQALRVDHVLNVLLFLSTALPIYAVARRILRSQWLAAAGALLSVAVPWLTLTSALFTENLSYPLFWWMILATSQAVWRPRPAGDALALFSILLLVCTRVQFAAVFVGYLLALVLRQVQLSDARHSPLRRARDAAAGVARAHPLSVLLLAGVVSVVVYEQASGQWQKHVEMLLGSYSNVIIRNGLPPNMGEGLLIELLALALGVGLLPAIVSIAWFVKRMARPRLDRRWVFIASSGIVLGVFLVLTVYSQGGYLGPLTEERYFFYVVPAFWLGTFAALEDGDVRAVDLVVVGLALALVYASISFQSTLSQEAAFLDPVESIVPHVLGRRFGELGLGGLSMQDALALIALVAAVATAVAWASHRTSRIRWAIGVAIAIQLVLTGYAFAVIDGRVTGLAGRTGGSVDALGWVDAHAHSGHVAWLDNLSSSAPATTLASPSADQLRTTLFWNSSVNSWVQLPQLGLAPVEVPMSALPGLDGIAVSSHSGLLTPGSAVAGLTEVVGASESPFLQLQGVQLARSPDGVLALTSLAHPVQALWVAQGLAADGSVSSGQHVRVAVYAQGSALSARRGLALSLTFVPPPRPSTGKPAHSVLEVKIGETNVGVRLTAGGSPARVHLSTCLARTASGAAGYISGLAKATLTAGRLQGVAVTASGAACKAPTRSLPPGR